MVQTVLFDCIEVYHPSQQCCSYAGRSHFSLVRYYWESMCLAQGHSLCARGVEPFDSEAYTLTTMLLCPNLKHLFEGSIARSLSTSPRFPAFDVISRVSSIIFLNIFFFKYHAAFGIICFLTTFVCLSIDTFITLQT